MLPSGYERDILTAKGQACSEVAANAPAPHY